MKKNSEESEPRVLYRVNADVIIKDSRWAYIADFDEVNIKHYINNLLFLVLRYTNFLDYITQLEVAVLLADDTELEKLNRHFCHKDKSTNVLSFPAYEFVNGDFSVLEFHNDEGFFLGNVAISYQRIYHESIEQMKSFKEHLTHILIHGFLHLLGHDHIEENEAEEMEQIEIAIMSSLGFKNPYSIAHVAGTLQIKY